MNIQGLQAATPGAEAFLEAKTNNEILQLLAFEADFEAAFATNPNKEVLTDLKAQNAQIIATSIPARLSKVVNTLILDFWLQDKQFTAVQLKALEQIAATCQLRGGPAVSQARTYWHAADQPARDWKLEESCASDWLKERVEKEEAANTIQVFPNPSKGQFQIRHPDGFSKNEIINIFDLNGSLLLTKPAINGQLDLGHLPTGMYILKIGNTFTEKIVILND